MTTSVNNSTGSFEKAVAFLNVWHDTVDANGVVIKSLKVGAIGYKASKAADARIVKRLQSGGDEALESLMKGLRLDFRMVSTEEQNAAAPAPF